MRLMIEKVRTLLSNRGRQFLDGRRVTTMQVLRDALQSWESTDVFLFPDYTPRLAEFQPRQISACNCKGIKRLNGVLRMDLRREEMDSTSSQTKIISLAFLVDRWAT